MTSLGAPPSRFLLLLCAVALSVTACDCGGPPLVDSQCLPEEICNNGKDDTCDGQIDEGCPCVAGTTRACGTDEGTCVAGIQTCIEDGVWGDACDGETPPSAEACNGLDDDCDGEADENDICVLPDVMCPDPRDVLVGRTAVIIAAAGAGPSGALVDSVEWSVKSKPTQSAEATPTPAGSRGTTFTADAEGVWTLTFCATDTAGATACCDVDVTAALPCTMPPSPPVSTACETSWDGRPILQFAPVPSGLFYEVVFGADVVAVAEEGHNHVRPASRIVAGADLPGEQVTLGVRACREEDPLCCSNASQVNVNVVSECATPVPATAQNLILSEYVVNGEGACSGNNCDCQNGEAIELTNLTNCPVSLEGFHFAYRNDNGTPASYRWMNFGPQDVVPPRGVYVAMRNRTLATACAADLGTPSEGLYGLAISALEMQGQNLCSGWFKNGGGGQSELRVAPGAVPDGASLDFSPGAAITRIAPYQSGTATCESVGFDAIDSCGNVVGGETPVDLLAPNQLGRLWHPCDAVVAPVPACPRD